MVCLVGVRLMSLLRAECCVGVSLEMPTSLTQRQQAWPVNVSQVSLPSIFPLISPPWYDLRFPSVFHLLLSCVYLA